MNADDQTGRSNAVRNPHILTIFNVDCIDCGERHVCPMCQDEVEQAFTIKCPGVTDACRMYAECDCADSTRDEDMWDNPVAHGVEHKWINGLWMSPTGQCFVTDCDDTPDAVEDLKPLAVGDYPIDFDVEDGTSIRLVLIPSSEAATA